MSKNAFGAVKMSTTYIQRRSQKTKRYYRHQKIVSRRKEKEKRQQLCGINPQGAILSAGGLN
jgi:hypothetical protein